MNDESALTPEALASARQSHWTLPRLVVDESKWRYPLDLPARVEWLREKAYASVSEADRHEILRAVNRLRNGTDA